jgi:hypothetical protein
MASTYVSRAGAVARGGVRVLIASLIWIRWASITADVNSQSSVGMMDHTNTSPIIAIGRYTHAVKNRIRMLINAQYAIAAYTNEQNPSRFCSSHFIATIDNIHAINVIVETK